VSPSKREGGERGETVDQAAGAETGSLLYKSGPKRGRAGRGGRDSREAGQKSRGKEGMSGPKRISEKS